MKWIIVIAGACLMALTACGSTTTIIRETPGPAVTKTVTAAPTRPTTTPKATPGLKGPNGVTITGLPTATPVMAFGVYPSWSTPGETVPSRLQPYTLHVNGATRFTIVICSEVQCTSSAGAGPDGSTCGQVVQNEQVCVA
jgi:hypothetical protein